MYIYGMGLIYADISLSNPIDSNLKSMQVKCLVDTGSNFLCIPEHVAFQLNLKVLEIREVIIADGSKKACNYVGPVKINFDNRQCYVGALVLGNQVLLGAIPIEDMDLVILPSQLKIIVNPQNPNIPVAIVM